MAETLCSSFTHCHGLGPVQAQRTRSVPCRNVVRASAGASFRDVGTTRDYRRVLGVGPNASKREVKAAYRRLALRLHPDVCRDDECEVNFMEVNRAYESLMAVVPNSPRDQSGQRCGGYEAADCAPPTQEGDPWADYLQSVVNGTQEQFVEDFSSYYSNLKYYSKAGRRRKYPCASQYYQGN